MKLYFRMFLLWLRLKKLPQVSFNAIAEFTSRVWPTDCDLNGHMTNTRYPNLFDLCHIQLFGQLGILPEVRKYKWNIMINARTITYLRELQPFQTFKVTTSLICWEKSYFYLEHRIYDQDKKISAVGYSRGLVTSQTGLKKFADVLAGRYQQVDNGILIDYTQKSVSPEMPEHIKHWKDTLNIQKKLLRHSTRAQKALETPSKESQSDTSESASKAD